MKHTFFKLLFDENGPGSFDFIFIDADKTTQVKLGTSEPIARVVEYGHRIRAVYGCI
jgi:hypothetical protein